jgi:hypothetical protein
MAPWLHWYISGVKRLIIALSVVGAILVAAVIFVVWPRSQQATEIAASTVDEVEARQIVYLEEHGVFVVSSDLGPIALSDDARHVGDRVLYCAKRSPVNNTRFVVGGGL